MRDSFEPIEGLFVAAVLAVGVDHGEQSAGELAQLGGVECLGFTEQHLNAAGAELGVARQSVDTALDHLGLRGGEPAVAHGFKDGRQEWPVDRGGQAHGRGTRAFVTAGRWW